MGRNKQVTCKICFKSLRSDNVSRHMKVHIVYTTVNQIENSEEICKDIVMEILDKMFVPEDSTSKRKHDEEHDQPTLKRKHCDDDTENCTTTKRNDAQDQPVIKRKYEIDYEDLEKIMKEETDEFDRKIALGEAIEKILHEGEVKQAALSKDKQESLQLYRRNVEQVNEEEKELESEKENDIVNKVFEQEESVIDVSNHTPKR